MNKYDILRLFKENLIRFFKELSEQFKDPEFTLLSILLQTEIPIEDVIKSFSAKIMPYAKMVKERDDQFFITHTKELFKGINVNSDKIDHFKNIWLNTGLTKDDKDALWSWFDLFLKLATKYGEIAPYAK